MQKVNCLICGHLAEQIFCPACSERGWQKYREIQQFLINYPGITIIELCREMSVSLSFIKGLVSAGYLNLNLPNPSPQHKPSGFHSEKNKK